MFSLKRFIAGALAVSSKELSRKHITGDVLCKNSYMEVLCLSASNIPEPLHVNLVTTHIENFFNAFTSQKKTISKFHISVTATAKNIQRAATKNIVRKKSVTSWPFEC